MQISSREFSFPSLRELARELASGTRSPAEICARYVLLHLHQRHPSQWLSGPRPSAPKVAAGTVSASKSEFGSESTISDSLLGALECLQIPVSSKNRSRLATLGTISELYQRFFFRGVVLDSHEGLVGWLERRYPLILRLDIPTPDEMLEIQCQGLRFVTLLLNEEVQFQPYGRHVDACAFLLHDFEHAHKFYGDRKIHLGQVRFFQALWMTRSSFARWTADLAFNKDLDYLKSDMNSHPVHLIKFLKAVVLSAEMRKTGHRHPPLDDFWGELFSSWKMSGETLQSALRINQPESETPADLAAVAEFFMPAHKISCEPVALEAT